jgi:hypothetical protein
VAHAVRHQLIREQSLAEDAPQLPDDIRSLFARAEPYILIMRGAGLVALVLAVFRPVLD